MKRLLAAVFLTVFFCGAHGDDLVRVIKVSGQFAEIKENVVTAIEERGLVINATSHIADMLQRTGGDIGQTRAIYGQGELLEFCSASASRAMMAAAPQHMVFCPYGIALYTLPGQPDEVFVAYRRLPDAPAFAPARELLEGIVRSALP